MRAAAGRHQVSVRRWCGVISISRGTRLLLLPLCVIVVAIPIVVSGPTLVYAESCLDEGGIFMWPNQGATAGSVGEIKTQDRTLAACGVNTGIAWSTTGMAFNGNVGNWVEDGWVLEYDSIGHHFYDGFTEWGLGGHSRNLTYYPMANLCTMGNYTWWEVVNSSSGSTNWTAFVDCEDGSGFRKLVLYSSTGYSSGRPWGETGRLGATGTTMQDFHDGLKYESSTGGTWYSWPSMSCQSNSTSNWYPTIQSGHSYDIYQGAPGCLM
jgi:hypothetical protein